MGNLCPNNVNGLRVLSSSVALTPLIFVIHRSGPFKKLCALLATDDADEDDYTFGAFVEEKEGWFVGLPVGALEVTIADGLVMSFPVSLKVDAAVGLFVETDDGFSVSVTLAVTAAVGFEVSLKEGFVVVVVLGVSTAVGFEVEIFTIDGIDVVGGLEVALNDGFSVFDTSVIFDVGFAVADAVVGLALAMTVDDAADDLGVAAAVAIAEGVTEPAAAAKLRTAIPGPFLVPFDVDVEVGLTLLVVEAGLMLDLGSFTSLGFSDFLAWVGFDDLESLFLVED